MKIRRTLSLWLALCMLLSVFAGLTLTASASSDIVTPPTGYTKASDVVYKTSSGTIANWGARGEDCVFLSKYAVSYYTGSYAYETMSQKSGGTSQSNAPSSALYKGLQSMMKAKHYHETSYNETRDLYCYTDCLKNDYSHISSFYSGTTLNGKWDSGKTWNREHTWPNSKGMGGNDENDIMMLRPTSISENSDRGNTAYGEGSNYFDPGVAVRGDCARIVLYVYTRWGNTGKMWGTSGVMENKDILLKWMEEDPVDTWEMGRNDSVESITGTRNVFVDYPEYAWLLFGEEIPSDMVTPSGIAASGSEECTHSTTEIRNSKAATCTAAGYTGDTYCKTCGELVKSGSNIPALGHNYVNGICNRCGEEKPCDHESTELRNAREAACEATGYTGDTYCSDCGELLKSGSVISALGHNYANGVCTRCGEAEPCKHENTERRGKVSATCTEDGYTGDVWCLNCGEKVFAGVTIKAMGHNYRNGVCANCGATEGGIELPDDPIDPDEPDDPIVPDAPECYFEDFSDCTDAWYHEAVDFAVENELMNGVGGGKFDPNGSMTRAMIVTVLYREAGSPEVEEASTFTDVPTGEWYSDAIAWAQDNKIVNGVSDTEFAPEDNVTREQIAAILWRYKGEPEAEADLSSFQDTSKISAYAEDAIVWAVSAKILNGDNGNLKPTDNATRAEFACIIMRYLGGSYGCENLK